MNFTIETCVKRKKQVEGTREALQAAEIEERGGSSRKIGSKKGQNVSEEEEQLLKRE